MALESCGTDVCRMVDNAFKTCHDMVLDEYKESDPNSINEVDFHAGQDGMWEVIPGMLHGKPCVEIRIVVG